MAVLRNESDGAYDRPRAECVSLCCSYRGDAGCTAGEDMIDAYVELELGGKTRRAPRTLSEHQDRRATGEGVTENARRSSR
jgi:hypothetical protein